MRKGSFLLAFIFLSGCSLGADNTSYSKEQNEAYKQFDLYEDKREEMLGGIEFIRIDRAEKIKLSEVDLTEYVQNVDTESVQFSLNEKGMDYNTGVEEAMVLSEKMYEGEEGDWRHMFRMINHMDQSGNPTQDSRPIVDQVFKEQKSTSDQIVVEAMNGLNGEYNEKVYLSKEPWEDGSYYLLDEYYYQLEDDIRNDEKCILLHEFPVSADTELVPSIRLDFHCIGLGSALSISSSTDADDFRLITRTVSLDDVSKDQYVNPFFLGAIDKNDVEDEEFNTASVVEDSTVDDNEQFYDTERNILTEDFGTYFSYYDHPKFEFRTYDFGDQLIYEFNYLGNEANQELFTVWIDSRDEYPDDLISYFEQRGYDENATYHLLYSDEYSVHYAVQQIDNFYLTNREEQEEFDMMSLSLQEFVEFYLAYPKD